MSRPIQFDEKATHVIRRAKVIARSAGERVLDGLHVLKAAAEFAPDSLPDGPWRRLRPSVASEGPSDAVMDASPDLSGVLVRLRASDAVVSLAELVQGVVAEPSLMMKRALAQIDAAGVRDGAPASAEPYAAFSEYLFDTAAAWRARHDLAIATGALKEPDATTKRALSEQVVCAERALARIERHRAARLLGTNWKALLRNLGRHYEGLSLMEMFALDGLLLDAVTGAVPPPCVLTLAALYDPHAPARHLRGVADALDRLVAKESAERVELDFLPVLRRPVRLGPEALDSMLVTLRDDALVAGDAASLRLSMECDFGTRVS